MTIDLLMPTPRMGYTVKAGANYVADEHGVVSVAPNHVHEMTAMGGVPLAPAGWTDPRIVAKPSN